MAMEAIEQIKEEISQKRRQINRIEGDIEALQRSLEILSDSHDIRQRSIPVINAQKPSGKKSSIWELARNAIREADRSLILEDLISRIQGKGYGYRKESIRIGIYKAKKDGHLVMVKPKTFSIPELQMVNKEQ